jgi:hypothetical protein
MDRNLWKVENYSDFLAARRELLAEAANTFLDSLLAGMLPEKESPSIELKRVQTIVPGGVVSEEEDRLIQECNTWIVQQGLPEGEYMYELNDAVTGEPLAVFDLAWPNGLQEGYSQPVALLIDEGHETEQAANRAGYCYFTDVEAFRDYVQYEILAMHEEEGASIAMNTGQGANPQNLF